jgi:shikimate kinase
MLGTLLYMVAGESRSTPLNVVLIGFMGCGKTTLGARLAEKLGFAFVDMDDCIVEKAGRSIPDIFAGEGEAGFRRIEAEVLEELLTRDRMVVATGGGVVTVPENHPRLRALGFVVWLNVPEKVVWSRVSRNRNRPLLRTPNPRQTVHQLMEKRLPMYAAAADLEADTKGLTPDEAAYGIAESVRHFFTRKSVPLTEGQTDSGKYSGQGS